MFDLHVSLSEIHLDRAYRYRFPFVVAFFKVTVVVCQLLSMRFFSRISYEPGGHEVDCDNIESVRLTCTLTSLHYRNVSDNQNQLAVVLVVVVV